VQRRFLPRIERHHALISLSMHLIWLRAPLPQYVVRLRTV
jgi:hypothetical protein